MARLRAYRKSAITTVFAFPELWTQKDFIGILQKARIEPENVTRREIQITFFPADKDYYSQLKIYKAFRSEGDPLDLMVEYIEQKSSEIEIKKEKRKKQDELDELKQEEENKRAIEKENKKAASQDSTNPDLFSTQQMKFIKPKGRDISNQGRDISNQGRSVKNKPRVLEDEFPRSYTKPGELTDSWNDLFIMQNFKNNSSSMYVVGMTVEIISENAQEEQDIISKLEVKGIPFERQGISILASIKDSKARGLLTPYDAENFIEGIIKEEKQEGQVPTNIKELRDVEGTIGKIGEFKQTTKYGDIEPTPPEE